MANGAAIYLVLNRRDIANDIEELIEGIGHETVVENLNNAVMNSADKKLSNLGEPEISVVKADTNWTDQDSEDQKCFSDVTVKQSYTLDTGGARTTHTN